MRKIKFRGLTDDHVWVYGWFTDDDLSPDIIDGMSTRHKVLSKTVGQYIGLNDSNGKEIYEGDIIASQSDLIPIFELKSPDYVVFHDGAFWLSDSWNRHNCKGTLLAIASVHNEIARCKVIGNIYDNPELLEVEA